MSHRTTSLDPRHIEYDGLAVVLFVLAFLLVAGVIALIVGSAAQIMDATVILASSLVGAAVIAAWIFGYPRYAAIPAMSLMLMCGVIFLPLIFNMDGAVLREAAGSGTPASRLYIAMGLYIGGLGILLLAFVVFGFIAPLAGAVLRLRRGEAGAGASMALHLGICALAIALTLTVRSLL